MSTIRPHGTYATPTDTDVAVVGYGPIGAALSVLLAQRGYRVTVLERRPRPYPLPRATSFDGETARLLAATGIGAGLSRITEPATGYQWRTAAGQTLLDIAFSAQGRYGWPDANTVHQPALEELLMARAASLTGITVLRGHRVVDITQDDQRVTLTAETDDGTSRTVRAHWVVGCDGANSFVREHLGVPLTDLGFSYEWLLCDVELHEPREFTPTNIQICDPARPTTLVGSGPGHRRWEFMRLPGESSAELNREETAWRLLKPFGVTPDTATLLRSTTYMFRAAWADEWRVGRVLLAGDAAHLMPPFAGQGMCSGIRDVVGLAWKLDLTLSGLADASLLDTHAEERRQHVKDSILSSVQLGRMICVTDPEAAAERDATVLAGRRGRTGPGQPEPAKPLSAGLLRRPSATPNGAVVPQGRVAAPGGTGLFDEVVGRGFVLLSTDDPRPALGADRWSFLRALGTRVVRLSPPGAGRDAAVRTAEGTGQGLTDVTDDVTDVTDVIDVDGCYRAYLAEHDATALLIRPDHHVFGAAAGPEDTATLVDDLRSRLGASAPAGEPIRTV
ncbi:bifunctional 3-(3-hydroxy-phenyl)propionate/3-hydroxycinnamic acid hydroxylase [Streptomyces sp. ALI-76-A]|jgi:flavoprotein hydroxylase|uniref:bifunctional 3-(3-hydroxy-phenyl)propionate/3-hydroxycinnamic acid hydroxylase MhpA n=1 Tax=Streptomyces sp. ALI-76-A TaxID=3025736 RepID=UPI00256ECA87|nr:bifunctional 3-(3-hydroxy-phenyl)propionate/3-hydroxycinnamic acid hydroxylase [Streptomyces sp. ALI-76-A]MDL5205430.1 bifunctional 3-(3-hydroxy-phenyl)propionate/3-hydroxycinnamic acid hydroxylase [Streptomyces sp. ALI-76-A]